jgi:pyrophosphatase PpaX
MKTYNYVLLDWDGSLAQTLTIWLMACKEVLEKRGHYLTSQEIGSSFGAFAALGKCLGIEDHEAIMSEADEIATRNLPNVELYPNALEMLEYLRISKKKMALITSSSNNHISGLLDKYDLRRYFHVVVTGDMITHYKPHPEPLEIAIKQLGADKNATVIIGDSDKDLGAARNAGIDSILFFPTEHETFYDLAALKQVEPTYIIESFILVKTIIT